jgi:hypothetical protein
LIHHDDCVVLGQEGGHAHGRRCCGSDRKAAAVPPIACC